MHLISNLVNIEKCESRCDGPNILRQPQKVIRYLLTPQSQKMIPTCPFLPDVFCDHTYLIWRQRIPFEAMTDHTAFIISYKVNPRRSVHSPWYNLIITLFIS